MKNIYRKIKEIRELKGFKQDDLANHLGLVRSSYNKIENGKTALTIENLQKIADFLGVSVKEILFDEESSQSEIEKNNKIRDLEKENHFLKKEISLLEKEIELLEKETELSELELEQVQDEINEVYSENENLKLKISNLLQVFNCIPRKIVNEALNDKPELKNTLFEIFRKYNIDA